MIRLNADIIYDISGAYFSGDNYSVVLARKAQNIAPPNTYTEMIRTNTGIRWVSQSCFPSDNSIIKTSRVSPYLR